LELGAEGGEAVRVEGVEGVEDEGAGFGAGVGLRVVEPEAEVVRVGGAPRQIGGMPGIQSMIVSSRYPFVKQLSSLSGR
jgi:hypothetical protein